MASQQSLNSYMRNLQPCQQRPTKAYPIVYTPNSTTQSWLLDQIEDCLIQIAIGNHTNPHLKFQTEV